MTWQAIKSFFSRCEKPREISRFAPQKSSKKCVQTLVGSAHEKRPEISAQRKDVSSAPQLVRDGSDKRVRSVPQAGTSRHIAAACNTESRRKTTAGATYSRNERRRNPPRPETLHSLERTAKGRQLLASSRSAQQPLNERSSRWAMISQAPLRRHRSRR